jgi:RNA polymerase sigma-70 factor (ECF subfamily)
MDRPDASTPAESSPLERRILEQVCLRQTDALNRFFDHFYDRVYGYLAIMLRDRTLAEDLTQDAFLRIHRGIDRLDPRRDPTGWVFTVVTNTVRDYWRSKEHKAKAKQATLDKPEDLPVVDTTPTAAESLEQHDTARAIGMALAELSEADREVILLRNYEGLSPTDIAHMLDLKPEAVRQRHSRAVTRLGQVYKKIHGQEPEG